MKPSTKTTTPPFTTPGAYPVFLLVIILLFTGCAQHVPRADAPQTLYYSSPKKNLKIDRFCPAFLVYNSDQAYNKIGNPAARLAEGDAEDVYIDPEKPAIFYSTQQFTTSKGTYSNIFYRVHFSNVPFSLAPFNLTAGKNVGLYVVITFDEKENPLLVTTVHTCGCYLAIVPTNFLPKDSFPQDWQDQPFLHVFGETLPSLLSFPSLDHNLVVKIGPQVHRVIDLEVLPVSSLQAQHSIKVPTKLVRCEELKRLQLPDGTTTSFFYDSGIMKGYVKGAVKPWESLLMSIVAMDFFVGTDKAFGETALDSNPFYTSLKPWRRQESNMWNFPLFLKYWGWRL